MPQQRRRVITAGMADHDACGFHSQRWADRFLACCELDGVNPPQTFIAPLAPDISGMAAAAGSEGALRERARLDELRTSQQLIVRVDRLEPTKNLVAGFEAFEQLLERRPDLVGRVTMVAYAYPSRSDLAPYRDLRHAVVRTVAAINDRHGSNDWTPVLLDLEDDLEAAAAGLTCYDVLLVNPVEDGLNLVVFEGAGLNQTHGTAVLSRTCGAHDQLRDVVESIDPIDVDDTSMALERALGLPPDERRSRSQSARTITMDQSSTGWIERLISAVG